MESEVWYTAREIYDSEHRIESSWENYIKWSRLTQLSELVSLDVLLSKISVEPNQEAEEERKYIVCGQPPGPPYFNSLDYLLVKTIDLNHFNLLAVIREPKRPKSELSNEFDFMGYELIEKNGDLSVLSNCGPFDESFLPSDLNEFGLVAEWEKAKKIQKDLKLNNPEVQDADCYLFEVWRHKTIGRKNKRRS